MVKLLVPNDQTIPSHIDYIPRILNCMIQLRFFVSSLMTLLSVVGVPEKEKYFSHPTSHTEIISICSITMSVMVTLLF
jgi:hypothetical protein